MDLLVKNFATRTKLKFFLFLGRSTFFPSLSDSDRRFHLFAKSSIPVSTNLPQNSVHKQNQTHCPTSNGLLEGTQLPSPKKKENPNATAGRVGNPSRL